MFLKQLRLLKLKHRCFLLISSFLMLVSSPTWANTASHTAPNTSSASESGFVLTSIQPLYLITRELSANTRIQVNRLLSPEQSPHHYALKLSDRQQLQSADLLIWLSPAMEPWLVNSANARPVETNLLLGASTSSLPHPSAHRGHESTSHDGHHHHDNHHDHITDPHIWLNPGTAADIAHQIATRLQQSWPDASAQIQHNVQTWLQKHHQTQLRLEALLKNYQQQEFFVYHNAYSHFVTAFGLSSPYVLYPQEGSSMSLKHLSRLQQQGEQLDYFCLFMEPQFKQQKLPTLADENKMIIAELDPIGIHADSYSDLLWALGSNMVSCFEQVLKRQ